MLSVENRTTRYLSHAHGPDRAYFACIRPESATLMKIAGHRDGIAVSPPHVLQSLAKYTLRCPQPILQVLRLHPKKPRGRLCRLHLHGGTAIACFAVRFRIRSVWGSRYREVIALACQRETTRAEPWAVSGPTPAGFSRSRPP